MLHLYGRLKRVIEDGRVKVGSEWLLTSAHSTGTKHRYPVWNDKTTQGWVVL